MNSNNNNKDFIVFSFPFIANIKDQINKSLSIKTY